MRYDHILDPSYAVQDRMVHYIFFGVMNATVLPIMYFFCVEPARCSLEEVNLLFTSDSPFVKRNVEDLTEESPLLVGTPLLQHARSRRDSHEQ